MSIGNELLTFIRESPSPYHAVETVRQELEAAGFTELLEGQAWDSIPAGGYYVIRNGTSLLAFRLETGCEMGFQIGTCHSDSPAFRVKARAEMDCLGKYTRLNVETYGGGLWSTWLDRPLSVAGRAVVCQGDRLESRLVHVDRDLLLIPNVAIHMNRKANDGYTWDLQTDLMPVLGSEKAAGSLRRTIAGAAGAEEESVLGMDLYLYCRTPGSLWGFEKEYVSSPRLDDLQCAFSLLKGFLTADKPAAVPVYALFDNEEVGSLTKQGADSTFLEDVLKRIGGSRYRQMIANSFLISADNAHGVHPNHPEYADPTNRAFLNNGIVIKYNGNQKYTTDGISEAVFRRLCQKAGVACQTYTNRSDMAGGSTLGNISNAHVSVNAVDIGIAQWAMHSAYETAGVRDMEDLIAVMELFYRSAGRQTGRDVYEIR